MTEKRRNDEERMTNDGGGLPPKGECGDGKAEETSPFSHTPLSRTSLEEGELGTGKVKGM